MCIKNTAERFGLVAQALHWIMGLLIVGMLGLGLYLEELERGPELFKLIGIHKSVGIIILALAVLRILWVFMNVSPTPLPNHEKWEKILAKSVQGIMYLAMLGMPLSGWVLSSSAGYPVSVFGWFDMPNIVGKSEDLHEFAEEAHEYIAWVLIGAIGLHIVGAYKHKFIDKDETMERMLPFGMKKAPTSENTEN